MEREELLRSLGIEPYKSPYEDELMKGIPKPKKTTKKPIKKAETAVDLLDKAVKLDGINKQNKFGSAGLGGLDKDGLGDALIATFNQIMK